MHQLTTSWWRLCCLGFSLSCGLLHGQEPVAFPAEPAEFAHIDVPAPTGEPGLVPVEQQPLEAELEALRLRLDHLEQIEAKRLDAKPKAPAADPNAIPTDKWNIKLGGHVQLEYVNWLNPDDAITGAAAAPGTGEYFEFRRLRLLADGVGYRHFDFRLQMTLEPEAVGTSPAGTVISPDVKDAYLSMNDIPGIGRLRIGNFFVPFSLEQVTNDTNNIFLERSIPTQGVFAADREVGIALYNCTEEKNVTWATGVFLDSISEGLKERIDNNQGYRVSGRLTWLPYYDEDSKGRYMVHTGIGILHTEDQDGTVAFRSRPQIHEGPRRLIDSGNLAATSYTTGNLEFAWVNGPITVQSEAFLSSVNMTAADRELTHGAYIHGSWFLTGENRIFERFGQHGPQFGRNVPNHNLRIDDEMRCWGAWEMKARWSYLNLDQFNRGQYNDFTIGLNWYWSDRTRIMIDWIHPVTSADTTFGSTQSDILGTRFDFNW